jgi:hypothetical protein
MEMNDLLLFNAILSNIMETKYHTKSQLKNHGTSTSIKCRRIKLVL